MADITFTPKFQTPLYSVSMPYTREAIDAVTQYKVTGADCASHDHWLGKLTTSAKTLDKFLPKEIEDYVISVADCIFKTSPHCNPDRPLSFDFHYWFNEYKKGDFQEAHAHAPKQLSAVWYLKGSPQDTVFVSPVNFWPFTNDGFIPDAEEGDMIFFPSSLIHHVLPAKEDGRLTIAFDFFDLRL